jgi:hypothetical protein
MTNVDDEFRPRGKQPGSILMLRPADAIEMVRRCRDLKILVYGADGFILHKPVGTEPTIDTIDVSDASRDVDNENNCWNLVERFLRARLGRDLFFEVCHAK